LEPTYSVPNEDKTFSSIGPIDGCKSIVHGKKEEKRGGLLTNDTSDILGGQASTKGKNVFANVSRRSGLDHHSSGLNNSNIEGA